MKTISTILLLFVNTFLFSQANVSIIGMSSQPYTLPISYCGTIDFQSNNEMNLIFNVAIDVYNSQSNNFGGQLYVYLDPNNGLPRILKSSTYVPPIYQWFNNSLGNASYYVPVNINASVNEFGSQGGLLYAEFVSANSGNSCSYHLIKGSAFNITPSNVDIACGDLSPITFSATDVNNTPGTKTYKWLVGDSWLYNGAAAPTEINTTSNTLTLVPNTYPLSNIQVATILNGTQLPYSMSTIELTPIQNRAIFGESTVCSSEDFSTNNLNANESVSWSISNNGIASISTSGNQATVYANGDGIITVTAIISNSCGQQLVLTKTLTIGVPTGYSDANIEVHPYPGNGGGIYLNNWTRMWMSNYPSGNDWNWTAKYSMINNADSAQPSIKPLSNGLTTIRVRKTNSCGNGVWVSKDYHITPSPGGGHHLIED